MNNELIEYLKRYAYRITGELPPVENVNQDDYNYISEQIKKHCDRLKG